MSENKIYDYTYFNVDTAIIIGLPESIILEKIRDLSQKCVVDSEHKKRDWVSRPLDKWQKEFFPYWSIYKISSAINSLERQGLIESEKLNSSKMDQSKWLRINLSKYEELMHRVRNNYIHRT